MIEIDLKKHLEGSLDVPVYLEHPARKPKRYVLFERTGSGQHNHLNSTTVAIQSYAETLYQAAKLNDSVKAAMAEWIQSPLIARVQLNSDHNFTDPESKQYRYQAVFEINHY